MSRYSDADAIRKLPAGYAHHKVILDDEGRPVDYVFLNVNQAFADLTGLKQEDMIGKTATELLPGIDKGRFDWIAAYGEVALYDVAKEFEEYSEPLKKWYRVYAYSPQKYFFTTIFFDVTDIKKELEEKTVMQSTLNDLLFVLDADFCVVNVIVHDESALLIPKEKMLGKTVPELFPRQAEQLLAACRTAEKNNTKKSIEYQLHGTEDQRWFRAIAGCAVINYEKRYIVSITDITKQKNLEEAKQDLELNYHIIADYAFDWEMWEDHSGNFRYVSRDCERISGYSPDEFMQNPDLLRSLILEEDQEIWRQHRHDAAADRATHRIEFRMRRKDGKVIWIAHHCRPVMDKKQKFMGYRSYNADITERREMEKALIESEEKYRLLTEYTSDVIWVYNIHEERYTYMSPSIYQLRGVTAEEAMQESLNDAVTPESFQEIVRQREERLVEFYADPDNPKTYLVESQRLCKPGGTVWVETAVKYRMNKNGEIEAVGVSRNIEERKKAEEEILYLSYHDHLTGLYNRRYFDEQLQKIDQIENLPIAIVLMDLNGLKLINDAFGYEQGNRVLKAVADTLNQMCGNFGIVARTGGDDFALLLQNVERTQFTTLIEEIEKEFTDKYVDSIQLSLAIGWGVKRFYNENIYKTFQRAESYLIQRKATENTSYSYRTIQVILNTLHQKSIREKEHSERVSLYCQLIGNALGMSTDELNLLNTLGLMHDIGKIAISDQILNKEGKLTPSEWREMKRHPLIGHSILSSVDEYTKLAEAVMTHHERWDGTGYPHGLQAEEIPLNARIVAVADAYDAMTEGRPYARGISPKEALQELLDHSGSQFDPDIVKVFLNVMQDNGEEKRIHRG